MPNIGPAELLLVVIVLGLWIWAIVDILNQSAFPPGTKGLWVLAVIVFPFLGSIAYLLLGRPRGASVS